VTAKTTSFTRNGINRSIIDRMKPAYLGAETALGTFLQIYMWRSPSVIFFLKQGFRLKQKMEICRIDIAIHHDFVLR
jgi:hypothetical protein